MLVALTDINRTNGDITRVAARDYSGDITVRKPVEQVLPERAVALTMKA
jgi:hypothetical protein